MAPPGARRPASVLAGRLLVVTLALLAGSAGAQQADSDVSLPAKNYLRNGSFERGSEGWAWFAGREAGGIVQDQAHSGRASLRVTGSIADYRYFEHAGVRLTPGRTYTLSAWIRCAGFRRAGPNSQVVNLANYGWTKGFALHPLKADEEWTRYSITFEAPPTVEAGGRPDYRVVVFWPVKTEGTHWIDDVQIEEGARATEYTECFLGWALDARAALRTARRQAGDARTALSGRLSAFPLAKDLLSRADGITAKAGALAGRLGGYAGLSTDEARALLDNARALQTDVASLRHLYFLGNPFLPLSEVPLPPRIPEDLSLSWQCLSGEQRAVALNVTNLTGRSGTCRVAPGELADITRGVRAVGVPWITAYTVPEIRGHLRPDRLFTDPLPRIGEAGILPLASEGITQAILLVDTSALLPGRYQGAIEVASLTEADDRRRIAVDLTVLPVRLPSMADKDVSDIGILDDYARESIGPLGINTFTVPAQWVAPEVGPAGAGKVRVDFSRVDVLVRDRLRRCPGARFLFCFGAGAIAGAQMQKAHGLAPGTAPFRAFATEWVKMVVQHFRTLGVPPARLVFETVDEPGAGQLVEAAAWAEILRAAAPEARSHSYVTSLNLNDPACTRLYETHGVVAPAFSCITDAAVSALKAKGKKVWVYDCQNSAETFHPIAYYRLLPWLAWRYQLDGWGHFSWLSSERGRGYVPWEGVAQESLVYPDTAGGQVISRRWLALLAGTQDYQVLRALDRLTAGAGGGPPSSPEAVARARRLLSELPDKALSLLTPGSQYFRGLAAGADPDALDRFRDEMAGAVAALVDGRGAAGPSLRASLAAPAGKTVLTITVSRPCEMTVRALRNHQLPWHNTAARVPAGSTALPLPCAPDERITRCLVEAVDADGKITTAAVLTVPRIEVDSTYPTYDANRLNDGLAMPGMKFEPEHGWISGPAAAEHWVIARLDGPVRVRGVRLWWMTFYGLPRQYKVQTWSGAAWVDAPGFTGWRSAKAAVEKVTFAPLVTDRVRILQNAGGGNATFPTLMGLSEVEVF